MHIVEKHLNNTTPFGKIRASHEGSLHSSTLKVLVKTTSLPYAVTSLRLFCFRNVTI